MFYKVGTYKTKRVHEDIHVPGDKVTNLSLTFVQGHPK